MKLKSNIAKIIVFALILSQIVLVGCSKDPYDSYIKSELNEELNVQGIEFLMDKSEVEAILGSDYELAPCVYGHEMTYSEIDLTVGIDTKEKVRKLIIKNKDHNVFSIDTKDSAEEIEKILIEGGFSKEGSHTYINDFISLKILSSDNQINGFILEKIES